MSGTKSPTEGLHRELEWWRYSPQTKPKEDASPLGGDVLFSQELRSRTPSCFDAQVIGGRYSADGGIHSQTAVLGDTRLYSEEESYPAVLIGQNTAKPKIIPLDSRDGQTSCYISDPPTQAGAQAQGVPATRPAKEGSGPEDCSPRIKDRKRRRISYSTKCNEFDPCFAKALVRIRSSPSKKRDCEWGDGRPLLKDVLLIMSSSSSSQATRQRLVENITLLWTLNEIPEQPKDNISRREDDGTRQLTPERERQLADSFAFISASTDNMLRVMAVSVEEDADRNGTTIRLASNTGDLSSMKKTLGDIAKTLEKAATRIDSRAIIRRELFKQIVTMDRPRILSRLRSRHAMVTRKNAGKPGLPALLSRTLNDTSIRASSTSKEAKVAKARAQTREIVNAFDKFETAYDIGDPSLSEDLLVDVLVQAYDFDIESLQVALQSSSLIDPSLVTFLPQAISKLGRYHCVTSDLIDAARSSQYRLFRRITINVLKEPVLDTRSITNGLFNFDRTLERITSLSHQQQVNRYGSNALSLARTKYNARISNRPLWKVHAEIQLLFFYEYNPEIPPPRFICSSKSACYLCDLFVKSHGKFCLPRTHGRLYDRWILPELSVHPTLSRQSIQLAIGRLNTTLEGKIIHTIRTKQPSFPHPNESVLLLREPWSSNSTLPALGIRPSIAEGPEDGRNNVTKELDVLTPMASADDGFSSGPALEEGSMESWETPGGRITLNDNRVVAEGQRNVDPSDSAVTVLSRGDTLCHRLTRSCDTLVVRTDAITVHASWDWSPTDSTRPASGASIPQDDCWVQVKWLSRGSHSIDGTKDIDCVDLETLGSPTDNFPDMTLESGSAFSQKALSIQKGGHVLVIQYYLEDPYGD